MKFISIHEVGHDFLTWQRKTYDILEDSESDLDAETRDRFEREANCFTSDVLFQLDTFAREAADHAFGITTPLNLSKRYGASFYATARGYVVTNGRSCALFVFNRPVTDESGVTSMSLRRAVSSPTFLQRFGSIEVPEICGPENLFFRSRPRGKFTPPTPCLLTDSDGDRVEAIVEAFDSTYEVFFLVYPLSAARVSFVDVS